MNCVYCMDGTPSQRRAGKGLSPRLCSRHRERLNRNGHPLKPSWRAKEVRPYIRVAERFIREVVTGKHVPPARGTLNPTSSVKATLRAYRGMVQSAGPSRRDLPRTPYAKARAILGRLRAKYLLPPEDEGRTSNVRRIEAEELAIRLAAVVVGLELAHQYDPAPGDAHFLSVQIGKVVHRLAGGHHRTFTYEASPPAPNPSDPRTWYREPQPIIITELNKYDGSRGASLLQLGKMLQERNLISERHARELAARIGKCVPVCPIANWTDRRAMEARPAKGGKRRKPYKPVGERGHDRARRK
jgi:hypothetical protein